MRYFNLSIAVLLLALLVRGGALLIMPDALRDDTDGYRRLAENLVEHGTFGAGQTPTAYRSPLYPLLLTVCVAVGDHGRPALGLLHVILGVATVGLTLALGRRWGLGCGGAALAALLVACDPILLVWSTQVMTETLTAFLTTAGLLALTWTSRRPTACRATLTGATLALGALCRPALLFWAVAAGMVLLLQAWTTDAMHYNNNNSRRLVRVGLDCSVRGVVFSGSKRRWRRYTHAGRALTAAGGTANKLRLPSAFILGMLVVLSPWAIRNQLQFGRPIITTTHGGYTLLLANNPSFYQWLRDGQWGSVWRADGFNADWDRRKPRDELQADRLAYAEAWRNIHREPGTFAYSSLVRIGRFWSPLPHQVVAEETPLRRLSRYAVAVWYVVEFFLAAVGVWRRAEGGGWRAEGEIPPSALRPPPWLWGLLLIVCLTAVHAVFWTDMRMRAAVMPVVALAAAAGLCRRERL